MAERIKKKRNGGDGDVMIGEVIRALGRMGVEDVEARTEWSNKMVR